jgi:glycerol uptake facilitator-like aquaporin
MLASHAISPKAAGAYIAVQCIAAMVGVFAAHAMFGEPLFKVSHKLRDGLAPALSEFLATFGLFATIFGVSRFKTGSVAIAVGLYITSAYWFTASTSFANPAVTLARSLSDTFAGIASASSRLSSWLSSLAPALRLRCSAGCIRTTPRGPVGTPASAHPLSQTFGQSSSVRY